MGRLSKLVLLLVAIPAIVTACTNEQTSLATPDERADFSANLRRTGVYDAMGVADDPVVTWQFQTGEWVFAAPAIAGDTVYFGSYDGHLYAVDAQTGEEQWRFNTGDIVISSPTFVDGRLYFGGMDGNVYALDMQGKELWRHEMGGGVSASPAVFDDLVVIGSEAGFLEALDSQSGELKWRADFESPIVFEAAIADGRVYAAGAAGLIGVLDLASGELLWQFDLGLEVSPTAGPVIADGAIYQVVANRSQVGNLYAIDIASQSLRWQHETPTENYASAAVTQDLVLLPGLDGVMRAIEVNTGQERWQVDTGVPLFSSPAIAEDTAYFGGGLRDLYAVDVRNGRTRWQLQLGGGVSSPAVNSEMIFVGSDDGRLNAIGSGG